MTSVSCVHPIRQYLFRKPCRLYSQYYLTPHSDINCFLYSYTLMYFTFSFFFFSSRRRHTRSDRDWSSDVCSSDLHAPLEAAPDRPLLQQQLLGRVDGHHEPQPFAAARLRDVVADDADDLAGHVEDRKSVV